MKVILLKDVKGIGKKQDVGWFNFNENVLTMVYNDCKISRSLIVELEKEFGKVDYIYTTTHSRGLFIVFEEANDEHIVR